MVNQIQAYQQCGRKAAQARRQGDEALAMLEKDYATRMWNVENPEDRERAQHEFREAYRQSNLGSV